MDMQTNEPCGTRARIRVVAITIVFACLFIRYGFGLNPTKSLRQLVLRNWTSEQGLPQTSIRPILQTQDGFLWIGTRGGLARFDGASFVLYKANALNSLSDDFITGLAEDRDGSLWISSASGLTFTTMGIFIPAATGAGCPIALSGALLPTLREESALSQGKAIYSTLTAQRCAATQVLSFRARMSALWLKMQPGIFGSARFPRLIASAMGPLCASSLAQT